MKPVVVTFCALGTLALAACGDDTGIFSASPDGGGDGVAIDAMPAPSPFVPATIESVMDTMVAAIATQHLAPAAKPAIAVLLKDLTSFWAPVVIGANRMSMRLVCPSVVEAPLIADPANTDAEEASALQNQYIQSYLASGIYRGMAYAAMIDNAESVQYINDFVARRGPVVTIDSDAADSQRSYLIATANYQAGKTAAHKLGEVMQPGDTVAVFGTTIEAWVSGIERAQGAEDGAAELGLVVAPRIPVIWDADLDRAAIVAALADPALNIKGLLCMYSNSARCAEAVEAVGKLGQVQIVGFDMQADTKAYFDKGYFYGIAVQRQYYMGELGVLVPYALNVLGPALTAQILQPLLVGDDFVDTGIDIITTANFSDYMAFLNSLGINA